MQFFPMAKYRAQGRHLQKKIKGASRQLMQQVTALL
jgi:hypothetical protein